MDFLIDNFLSLSKKIEMSNGIEQLKKIDKILYVAIL